ncbi:hypothetical protein BD770DRAFT_444343 [Pilaira anomala]|nr:hypothetical protein BD770DRAFT_444343 [Pilaira anomala]
MSLNTVIAFALLLKKITRKGSMKKKQFNTKPKKRQDTFCSSSGSSSSSSSSEEDEEEQEVVLMYNNPILDKKSNSSIISPSIKSIQKHVSLQPLEIINRTSSIILLPEENTNAITETVPILTTTTTTATTSSDNDDQKYTVIVRDFAYPIDHPHHFGKTLKPKHSTISLSSPDFNGRDARALFDFTPETEYELPLKQGQLLWVQYRQCPGWLVADVQDETGLIPETYIEFI